MMDSRHWKPIADRFWSKVGVGKDSDCWEWTASLDSHGYGQMMLVGGQLGLSKRRPISSSRIAYVLYHGMFVLPNECVLHTCDNRKCCNPGHLWLGSRLENNRDTFSKGRARPRGKLYNRLLGRN